MFEPPTAHLSGQVSSPKVSSKVCCPPASSLSSYLGEGEYCSHTHGARTHHLGEAKLELKVLTSFSPFKDLWRGSSLVVLCKLASHGKPAPAGLLEKVSGGDASDGISSGLAAGAPVIQMCCLQGNNVASSSPSGATAGLGPAPRGIPHPGCLHSGAEAMSIFTLSPPPWRRRMEEWGRRQRWLQPASATCCLLLLPSSWQQNSNQINGLIAPLLVPKLILLSAFNKC